MTEGCQFDLSGTDLLIDHMIENLLDAHSHATLGVYQTNCD